MINIILSLEFSTFVTVFFLREECRWFKICFAFTISKSAHITPSSFRESMRG